MKKLRIYRALLLIAHCVPFAFLCVNGDAVWGTMLFYGVMAVGFGLLCWGAIKTKNVALLYLGNLLSFLSSFAAMKLSGLAAIGEYFKPFTAFSLIVFITVAALVAETAIVLFCEAKKNKEV